jgi:flagellar hook assembly protein FlgD
VGSGAFTTGLAAARPNPFRGGTQFEFTLARSARVELAVYDVMGREVRRLAPAHDWPAGVHALAWDGRRDDGAPAGPGLYYARLRVDGASHIRTVVKLDR